MGVKFVADLSLEGTENAWHRFGEIPVDDCGLVTVDNYCKRHDDIGTNIWPAGWHSTQALRESLRPQDHC
jgi:hypothetical protein